MKKVFKQRTSQKDARFIIYPLQYRSCMKHVFESDKAELNSKGMFYNCFDKHWESI